MENTKKTMEKIVALCKGRGFVYPGSEIYGGLANTWDYGPLGMALKNNIKAAWLKKFVQENKYNVGLDAAILMNPQTWVASGHVGGFSDPKMDCKECKTRHRADDLIEDFMKPLMIQAPSAPERMSSAIFRAVIPPSAYTSILTLSQISRKNSTPFPGKPFLQSVSKTLLAVI